MENQHKPLYIPFLLSMLSALLLWLGWVAGGFFLFVAFLPLLEIEVLYRPSQVLRGKWIVWAFTFIAFWLGNILLCLWLFAASFLGAMLFTLLNALMMTLPFVLFRLTKSNINDAYGYFSLILYWLSMEYLQLHLPFGGSALVLGNAFATMPDWVQWYEFTGVLGGSLWVLLINVCLYLAIRSYYTTNKKIFGIYAFLSLSVALLASWMIRSQFEFSSQQVNIALVQPGFKTGKSLEALDIPAEADVLLLPDMPKRAEKLPKAKSHLKVETYLDKGEAFREAFYIKGDSSQHYRQSRFLIGLEIAPLPLLFEKPPFDTHWKDAHTWAGQPKVNTFEVKDSTYLAAVIAYEAFSGDFLNRFVEENANILVFFPADDWGFSSVLSKVYFQYARLRAIEQRRAVVVVSNRGVSGFISPKGEIVMKTNYQLAEAHQASLSVESVKTVYAEQGDYIGRLAMFLAVGLFLTGVIKNKTGGKTVIKAGLK